MPKFKVPCSWEVSGYVIVDTDTVQDAIDYCDDAYADMVPLPEESSYIDGSFRFNHEGDIDLIETV